MKFGICVLAILPVRRDPSERSEMLTQLLFGEIFEVLDSRDLWLQVRSDFDSYTGWIDGKTVLPVTEETFSLLRKTEHYAVAREITRLTKADGTTLFILPGSSLPFYGPDSLTISIEKHKFLLNEKLPAGIFPPTSSAVAATAMLFTNAPYMWGGRSFFGVDCSGFTQVVYKIHKIKLLRDAHDQMNEGHPIDNLGMARVADLAFFTKADDQVTHTGILLENNRIIHASGRVRIDRIDEKGIFNEETSQYSHNLTTIRRVFREF